MQKYSSLVLFGALVAMAAVGCRDSSGPRKLGSSWSDLKIPNAEHADILVQPTDRDPGWQIDYRGVTQFYGMCKEFELALQPLGFVTAGELPSTTRTTSIFVTKGDQTWDLSCTRTSDDNLAVVMRLLEPRHAAALLAKANKVSSAR